MRKIIQISVARNDTEADEVFALCNDETIWSCPIQFASAIFPNIKPPQWFQLPFPKIPQPEPVETYEHP